MILTDDEARRIMGVAGALGLALGLGVTSCAEQATVTGPEARLDAPVEHVAATTGERPRSADGPGDSR